MKKHSYISLITGAVGIFVFSLPLITSAETVVETEASVGIGTSVDAGQTSATMKVRDTLKQKIQQNYQTYTEKARVNEDSRNAMLEKRVENSSTTYKMRAAVTRPITPDMARKLASSTGNRIENKILQNRERVQAVHAAIFTKMHENLVRQLTHALDNLKQIRARIAARITTETGNGKDMSSAITLLATADAKIVIADQAIRALKAYTPIVTTTVQASTTIELGKPREIGANAIAAVKEARKALNDVIVAIARALGITVREE